MGSVFSSYRRDDGGHGRALYEFLCHWFDDADVFYDHESLDPGQKFRPELTKAIQDSKVFLAVIGPHWFSDRNRQRLADTEDTTRNEILTALKQERAGLMTIIPALCGGAGVPDNSLLPAEIAPLFKITAHHLPESQYRPAQQKLLDHLKNLGLNPRYRPRHGTTQIFHTIDHNLTKYFSDPAGNLSLLYTTLHETGLAAVTASVATAALHGMGGVGKTQLALKYSHDYRDEYAGVWWFRAEDLNRLQQDCQQFCDRCGIQAHTGEEHHQAVKRWLQDQPRWLLVYDNAEAQYGEQKENLHPYLPGGDHHVLITSRGNCWDGLAKPIELDVWDEEQALEFLRKRLDKATDGELRALCRTLGGLPLALEQACAYIVKVGVSVDGYCRALEDWEKGEKLLDRKDSLATGYSHSVLATLSLAFGRLSEGARELLRLCGWFAAEPIPESVFRIGDTLLQEALSGMVTDELRWREVVAELSGYALAQVVEIDMTPNGANERVNEQALLLHRLTQQAIRLRISEPEKDCGFVVELLCAVYPEDPMYPQHWPVCAVLMPHVLGLDALRADGGWIKPERYSWLLHGVAGYVLYSSVGHYRDATQLLQRALNLVKDKYGEEHHNTLAIKNNIALTYKRQGDFDTALLLEKQIYEIRIRTLGNEHNDTLASMNSIAETLWEQEDYEGALSLEKVALETRRRILGEGHPDVLFSMHNLSVTLSDLGDFSGARKLEEKALEISLRLHGEEHPETLRAYNNMSMTLKAQGNFSSARVLLEKTLVVCRRVFGINHHDTSIPSFNLFELYIRFGLFDEARKLYHSDLAWLLDQESAELGAYHRRIQGWLRELFAQYPYVI